MAVMRGYVFFIKSERNERNTVATPLMKLLNDEDFTIEQTCNAFMYSEPSIKVGVIGFTSVVSLPLLHTCDTVIL